MVRTSRCQARSAWHQLFILSLYTNSGATARRISRSRPLYPVVALCDRPTVARRARLYFGIRSRRVEIPRLVKHSKYGKYVRRKTVCYVHDENNESHAGDTVEIVESRPMSKQKPASGSSSKNGAISTAVRQTGLR